MKKILYGLLFSGLIIGSVEAAVTQKSTGSGRSVVGSKPKCVIEILELNDSVTNTASTRIQPAVEALKACFDELSSSDKQEIIKNLTTNAKGVFAARQR